MDDVDDYLKAPCWDERCGHRQLRHTAGGCTVKGCPCQAFQDESARPAVVEVLARG